MKSLTFGPSLENTAGLLVRGPRFETRSALPVSAACVVANGVREMLSSLLGTAVTLRLTEPMVPAPDVWDVLLGEALFYRIAGAVADAGLIFSFRDATALVGAAFGEPQGLADEGRALSAIEHEVLDRMVEGVAVNLSAVCGVSERLRAHRVENLLGFATFFELIVEKPVQARIGVALSREPTTDARGTLEKKHLSGVPVTAVASIELGRIDAGDIFHLQSGSLLPIRTADLSRCRLTLGGRAFASGSCGARNGRFAISMRSLNQT